jgi:pSer/pThr/pTyr-binding forkhead associated (FHA) protein
VPLTLLVRSTLAPSPQGISTGAPSQAPALTFDGGRVVIGRGQGCDVRLPDPSVSQRHAIIRVEGGKHSLIDEGSTNGTFVGGVRLSPHAPRVLRTGDLIRVGRVWLEARIDQTPPTRELAVATRELALMLVSQAMEEQGDDVVPKVRVVEGPDAGAVLSLLEEGRAYIVGRDDACDLALADADSSREHLQLVRRGPVVLVRDPGSKNGALLGESRLARDRDVVWRSTTMVRVGRTVLALEEPVAQALGALEDAADEPILDADIPPEPAPVSIARAPEPATDASAPPSSLPASVGAASAAPIAQVVATSSSDTTTAPPAARARGGWSPTDLAVVFAATLVIALSVAGLVWLLKT